MEIRTIFTHCGRKSSFLLPKYGCMLCGLHWNIIHCTAALYAAPSLSEVYLNKVQLSDKHWCNLNRKHCCWQSHHSIMETVPCCHDNIRLLGIRSGNENWIRWTQFSFLKEQRQWMKMRYVGTYWTWGVHGVSMKGWTHLGTVALVEPQHTF